MMDKSVIISDTRYHSSAGRIMPYVNRRPVLQYADLESSRQKTTHCRRLSRANEEGHRLRAVLFAIDQLVQSGLRATKWQ
jgi:hypothetical protein